MRSDNLSSANDAKVQYCEHDLPWFICGTCSWKSQDELRPPETDEEPWAMTAEIENDYTNAAWLGALMLVFAVVLGVIIGRLSS